MVADLTAARFRRYFGALHRCIRSNMSHALIVLPAGEPGTLARRVQENPAVAVEMLGVLRLVVAHCRTKPGESVPGALLERMDAVIERAESG